MQKSRASIKLFSRKKSQRPLTWSSSSSSSSARRCLPTSYSLHTVSMFKASMLLWFWNGTYPVHEGQLVFRRPTSIPQLWLAPMHLDPVADRASNTQNSWTDYENVTPRTQRGKEKTRWEGLGSEGYKHKSNHHPWNKAVLLWQEIQPPLKRKYTRVQGIRRQDSPHCFALRLLTISLILYISQTP